MSDIIGEAVRIMMNVGEDDALSVFRTSPVFAAADFFDDGSYHCRVVKEKPFYSCVHGVCGYNSDSQKFSSIYLANEGIFQPFSVGVYRGDKLLWMMNAHSLSSLNFRRTYTGYGLVGNSNESSQSYLLENTVYTDNGDPYLSDAVYRSDSAYRTLRFPVLQNTTYYDESGGVSGSYTVETEQSVTVTLNTVKTQFYTDLEEEEQREENRQLSTLLLDYYNEGQG
ncbi:MAG: hypothetical protein ACI4KF_02255 [Huintestinicola sp.]